MIVYGWVFLTGSALGNIGKQLRFPPPGEC